MDLDFCAWLKRTVVPSLICLVNLFYVFVSSWCELLPFMVLDDELLILVIALKYLQSLGMYACLSGLSVQVSRTLTQY